MFTRRPTPRVLATAVAGLGLVASLTGCSHSGKTGNAQGGSGSSVTSPSASDSAGGRTPTATGSTSHSARPTGSAGRTKSSGGSVVPSIAISTRPAVPFASTGDFGGGVTVKVTKMADQTSSDSGPGTIKGQPAVAFTLAFTNKSGRTISVNTVNVTATYGSAHTPASPANSSSNTPLSGQVKPGDTATGVYAFAIPKADRDDVSLQLWYAQGQPVVVISGAVG